MAISGEGGPVISGTYVRVSAHPIVVADKHADGTPIVTLKREGNLIREIQIRCACGETIVLDCEYAAAAGTVPHSPHVPAKGMIQN